MHPGIGKTGARHPQRAQPFGWDPGRLCCQFDIAAPCGAHYTALVEAGPSDAKTGGFSSVEKTRAERLERAPDTGPHAMVRLLARVIGIGIETADMLVREILSRKLRDRRAVARYAGFTGSPDESGLKRREKGLAKAGNARVRRGLIQLAWRFLMFQKDSALARWYRTRTEGAERRAQDDDDRGTGAQAANRAVAPGHDRRGAGRCRAAAGGVSNTLEREGQTGFGN